MDRKGGKSGGRVPGHGGVSARWRGFRQLQGGFRGENSPNRQTRAFWSAPSIGTADRRDPHGIGLQLLQAMGFHRPAGGGGGGVRQEILHDPGLTLLGRKPRRIKP